jgi:hypothetical protein
VLPDHHCPPPSTHTHFVLVCFTCGFLPPFELQGLYKEQFSPRKLASIHKSVASAEVAAPTYSSVNFHIVSMHANSGCLADNTTMPTGSHSVVRGDEAMAFVQMSVCAPPPSRIFHLMPQAVKMYRVCFTTQTFRSIILCAGLSSTLAS